MDVATKTLPLVFGREVTATPTSAADELLLLLQNPFGSQLQVGSIWASVGTSFGVTAGIALLFSLIRPYHTVVYAPKLKHADEQHVPPPMGKGVFAWVGPLWKTNEQDLIRMVGLDAAIFMRFTLMCRNMFLVLAVIGCAVLIPINYTNSVRYGNDVWISMLGPANVFGNPQWATSIIAWVINIVVCAFLLWNYRKVLTLRRQYFESPEYQMSLHSRTLMMYDIPKQMGSDEGIARIIDEVAPNSSFSRTAIARNVKVLPELIKEHDKAVRALEKVLAKYLKDPQNLPAARPQCKPSKKDHSYDTYPKGQKVDAIEYLTQRIKDLEIEIKEVRQSVDKRNTMSYGFASYSDISEAHSIAYAARKKRPQGATIRLATRPNDIIWDNLPLTAATRSRRRFMNNLWVALLTLLWVAPNAMIAIFLVNLSNLGLVWSAFQTQLETNTHFWQLVQGVASPALTSAVYLLLPVLFRRLAIQSGDQTKTGRERHVLAKLYSFFVFNNLVIFSLFSAVWGFISAVLDKTSTGEDGWKAIVSEKPGDYLLSGLCNISPFWITWLLQRQMGVAVDLAQLWPLFWGFIMRKVSSPTPREMIELTAPPPFDYASYYNYFLFYSTVALCFAVVQPLVLAAAAIYFAIDVVLRKYLILYVFVTKTESGGVFWRVLFNRMVFGTILANLVAFLIVFVRGNANHYQAYVIAPLPFLMIAFKWYCARTYDDKMQYYTTQNVMANPEAGLDIASKENLRSDRLAARFGHPALYKPLITPMVHAKAQNILASVYSGRLTAGREAGSGDSASVSGYSDTYVMDPMNAKRPGKAAGAVMPGFEVVPESRLDFEYYKNRDEFADEHGGGEIFGTARDLIRPGTPGSMMGATDSRPGTPVGGMTGRRQFSINTTAYGGGGRMGSMGGGPETGTIYEPGYNKPGIPSPPIANQSQPMINPVRTRSPSPYDGMRSTSPGPNVLLGTGLESSRSRSPMYSAGHSGNDSLSDLVGNAAAMPVAAPIPRRAVPGHSSNNGSFGARQASGPAPGMYGGGPGGYGNLPQEELEQDPTHYDYFRGGNRPARRETSNTTPSNQSRANLPQGEPDQDPTHYNYFRGGSRPQRRETSNVLPSNASQQHNYPGSNNRSNTTGGMGRPPPS
ncbi:uncharacterized protein SPSK_02181 [Sporothrix schenckii 1099-18]|uniref:DUF221 domain protein n=1 Tax=Sporothrix schenckii 1099-18 TaxID=1397361 RepID=A0A0F2M933_SPOSC|nr:uncharacterized protein SPSK_02181 [Sporothrix schenckii 1099-18]KJR86213.1 hypothetical protein SPSK_02181 [Sporothrix schenckii 1099-18]